MTSKSSNGSLRNLKSGNLHARRRLRASDRPSCRQTKSKPIKPDQANDPVHESDLESNMPVIGITGGISTGKTSFCDCLREILPARFFNADAAARKLANEDPAIKEAIRREFGPEIYSRAGDLNRRLLRSIVFADAGKKRALEQILHPPIRRQWSLEAEDARNAPDFSSLISLSFMKPMVKPCAIAWSWSLARPKFSSPV